MAGLFTALFSQPIFNALIFLYNVIPGKEIAYAIIALTALVKLVLWPITAKALKSQKALADLQPKVEELKKRHSEDKEELSKQLMALYSREKVSPASSCLPLLIQIPVFIALYQALGHGLKSSGFELLYSFVANPGKIDTSFHGWIDLAAPSPVLAILAGVTQFFQAKMTVTAQQPKGTPGAKDEAMLAAMNKQMLYFMPVVTAAIGWRLPGGLALYWCVMNGLTLLQQYLLMRVKKPSAALVSS